jgi:hypothetical protein
MVRSSLTAFSEPRVEIELLPPHACVLLASGGCTGWNKFEFLTGRRVSFLFATLEQSWQSGGHEFDPRQIHFMKPKDLRINLVSPSSIRASISSRFTAVDTFSL